MIAEVWKAAALSEAVWTFLPLETLVSALVRSVLTLCSAFSAAKTPVELLMLSTMTHLRDNPLVNESSIPGQFSLASVNGRFQGLFAGGGSWAGMRCSRAPLSRPRRRRPGCA